MASSFMTVMVALVFVSSTATLTKAQDSSCAAKLVPCQPFLATTTTPPDSCCNSIKEAVTNELPCLCKIYNDPILLPALGVNVTQVELLSKRCGVPSNLTTCNVLAPTPAGTPPGVPGKDSSSRMAWTGFSGLLTLLVAALLY
ncbi:hypothetical protein OIU85_008164 [Salix viminalis]|uniref:Bifunctional inhibitor/plant lipid transfer protein/seed storage helical domain-containing protein n=1 Tax=Salix viminalis TaxID=40686 RepID=A0A9Q0NX64_SALVM|nr:hypothetical protein OIU85_008164 [Salix viminalis]